MNIKDSRPTGGLKLLYAKGLKNLKVFLADVKKDWSHPVLYLSNYRLTLKIPKMLSSRLPFVFYNPTMQQSWHL